MLPPFYGWKINCETLVPATTQSVITVIVKSVEIFEFAYFSRILPICFGERVYAYTSWVFRLPADWIHRLSCRRSRLLTSETWYARWLLFCCLIFTEYSLLQTAASCLFLMNLKTPRNSRSLIEEADPTRLTLWQPVRIDLVAVEIDS